MILGFVNTYVDNRIELAELIQYKAIQLIFWKENVYITIC